MFITKTDPEQEGREVLRRLELRLLRESIRYYTAKGTQAGTMTRIPPYRDLNWSSETWVRAVSALKPHIIAKQGRGAGTYCTYQYPNLMALYAAVGERRIKVCHRRTVSAESRTNEAQKVKFLTLTRGNHACYNPL